MAFITVTTDGVVETAKFFDTASERVDRAKVRAANRAIGAARTVMVRAIAQDTGLPSRKVRESLAFQEATIDRPSAMIAAKLKRIPLIDFNARGPEPSRGKGRGVRWRLKGSRGHDPHAFIATMPSGHRGVFKRTPGKFMRNSPTRQAIHELHGPSLGEVFQKHRPAAIARAQEMFAKNMKHELEFAGVTDAGSS